MADRLIRITTAFAVLTVAMVAAVISYRHAYELVRSHGESGATARLVPFTVDGLIWAASMVILDANRRNLRVPALAKWSLGVGIVATVGANVAHGLNHGTIGALVSAWPALALVGSFELLMTLTRNAASPALKNAEPPTSERSEQVSIEVVQSPEDAVLADYVESLKGPGKPLSQRFLAEKHGIDRRRVKRIISAAVEPGPALVEEPRPLQRPGLFDVHSESQPRRGKGLAFRHATASRHGARPWLATGGPSTCNV